MKVITAVLAVLMAGIFVGSVVATPPGMDVEYAGGGFGKVIFGAKVHADKGLKCEDCHIKPFQFKKEAKMTVADHQATANKYCFACHNGTRAFGSTFETCARCHKK